ncbi:Gfo/Idh/MocA family oxidoreductase [Rhodocaloribacter litoris]|uniref:Gfo/Idh/MocA family protein n=1 Tax=Rhodocaloribacter litoris TaxID=2558931 RepID=UPI00141F802D|nr:Gfo/Idh/MocA family oxidoreductase [Rhodocaloribacter litoris]QXD14299.1 Gfo/Idh/MocA family oxidoreductase [Rhodocaloribacter litoris]GIV60700.1 MAG: dehydrogenase [Rhodothermaceae bacterium]
MAGKRLGIGFIGSGFITRFHIRSWQAVRDADILGIWSPTRAHAEEAAALARLLHVGEAKAYASVADMVADPDIDAIWICGPNHRRIENMEEIVHTLKSGRGELVGIACEKPLARNVAEAKRVLALVEEAGVLHGYLEDQLFSPGLARGREIVWTRGAALTGRPYLARAAEEHSGPHGPWFWQGPLQGGGVLNDMMCHSVEVARFLLTKPGAPRHSIRPVKVSAQIASLKWSRPEYADWLRQHMGADIDYRNRPSEDFARATIFYEDEEGHTLVAETTTSWSYVGAGLRLSAELLGPEYSMSHSSLDSGVRVFFSRNVHGEAGEDLVEKQNAEQGLMPVVGNEASEYGYEDENRHFVRCFLEGRQPELDFRAGLEVVELLMTAYMSAEQERTLPWKPEGLDTFVPAVARGAWQP